MKKIKKNVYVKKKKDYEEKLHGKAVTADHVGLH